MKYLNMMIPTYKRTPSLRALIESALVNAADQQRVLFTFCVNENDEETLSFIEKSFQWPQPGMYDIVLEKTDQPNLAHYFNLMYDAGKFNGDDTTVSMLGDDMEWLTKNYDSCILAKLSMENDEVVVYCNDNYIAGESLCVNLFTSRKVVRASGRPFMCPIFHAEMIDVVWHMTGKMSGILRYLPDVLLQHNHNTRKPKEAWDDTFKRLVPLQTMANSKENQRKALIYSTYSAGEIIDAGIGSWAKL